MHELLHNMVNAKDLKKSKELESSIKDDIERSTINSVKLRAAAQNVDYPAFAALVSCAHLKSMTRKELDSSRKGKDQSHNLNTPAWSFDAKGNNLSIPNMTSMLPTSFSYNKATSIHKLDCPVSNGLDVADNQVHVKNCDLSCFQNPLFESNECGTITHELQATTKLASCLCEQDSNPTKQRALSSLDKGEKLCKDCISTCNLKVANINAIEDGARQEFSSNYTSDLFVKEWRRLMTTEASVDRLLFLSKFPPSSFPTIFKVEIPPFLLGQILDTLLASLPTWLERVSNNTSTTTTESLSIFSTRNYQATISKWLNNTDDDYLWKLLDQAKLDVLKSRFFSGKCNCTTLNLTNVERAYVHWVAIVMDALSNCGRFGLAIKLMGHNARHTAAAILDIIFSTINKTSSLDIDEMPLKSIFDTPLYKKNIKQDDNDLETRSLSETNIGMKKDNIHDTTNNYLRYNSNFYSNTSSQSNISSSTLDKTKEVVPSMVDFILKECVTKLHNVH